MVTEVHQVDSSLHHAYAPLQHDRVDQREDLRIDVVLRIEHRDYLVRRGSVPYGEGVGLVEGRFVVDRERDRLGAERLDLSRCGSNGADVVSLADDDYLEEIPRVARIPDSRDGVGDHPFFFSRRQQRRETQLRFAQSIRPARRAQALGRVPCVEHDRHREQ